MGAFAALPAGWIRAVDVPDPWPASLSGSVHQLSVPWSALKGASLEPHVLELHLSAERKVGLALRGADLNAVGEVLMRIDARLGELKSDA